LILVIEPDRSCAIAASSNPLHIVVTSATRLGCGTKSQPWIIEAPSGQQINVSLLDFGLMNNKQDQLKSCQQYGYVTDKSANKNVSLCKLGQEGQTGVYKSHANVIELITDFSSTGSDDFSEINSIVLIGFYGNVDFLFKLFIF